MKIEDNPAFAEKLPRICYILGGEKTPLKIGEKFEFKGEKYRVEKDGVSYDSNSLLWPPLQALYDMINQPELIIRRPRFSDDEKALMRLYVSAGYSIFKRLAGDQNITAWEKSGVHGRALPDGILMQISEKFDAAAYLESEESK